MGYFAFHANDLPNDASFLCFSNKVVYFLELCDIITSSSMIGGNDGS